jgi:hypothetical protein
MKNLHLIKTDKPSKLYKVKGKYYIDEYPVQSVNVGNQHIYITNDSDIIVKDYVVVSCSEVNIEEVRIVTGYYNEQFLFDDKSQIHMDYCKKIILTTDEDLIANDVQAIDDEFLEWFVKNPSCETVEVVSNYRVKSGTIEEHKQGVAGYEYYEYKIIIPQEEIELNKLKKQFQMKVDEALELNSKIGNFGKEEPKQEVLEEAKQRAVNYMSLKGALKLKQETLEEREPYWDLVDKKAEENNSIDLDAYAKGVEDGAKWMQEQMYSEEDMIDFAEYVASYSDKNRNIHNQMLHAKSKYDGAERTIDLLEIWLKEFKTK